MCQMNIDLLTSYVRKYSSLDSRASFAMSRRISVDRVDARQLGSVSSKVKPDTSYFDTVESIRHWLCKRFRIFVAASME